MKINDIKRLVAGFCTIAAMTVGSTTALAADTVDVTGSGRYADSTQVVVGYQDKDLFSHMRDLMPGDTVSNEVTVSNKSGRSVTIYLKAYSDYESSDGITAVREERTVSAEGKTFRADLLDQIAMTVRLGEEVLYKGSADGKNPEEGYSSMTAGDYGISLGSFYAGEQQTLTVELTLPGPAFDNSFASRFNAVDWVFRAEGTTPSGGGGGGGGGGSDNTGNPSYKTSPTIIEDSDVPLDQWTGNQDGTNVVITDPDIPLAAIPKMGDEGIGGYVFGISLALLLAAGALYLRKRLG